jgi:hypothetical protein
MGPRLAQDPSWVRLLQQRADHGATIVGLRFDLDSGSYGYNVRLDYSDGATVTMPNLSAEDLQGVRLFAAQDMDSSHRPDAAVSFWPQPPDWHRGLRPSGVFDTTVKIPPEEYAMKETLVEDVADLRGQAARLLEKLARAQALADRFPNEPPDLSVLKWLVTHGSGRNAQEFTYVALHAGERWFLSGEQGGRVMLWPELRATIGDKPCWLATGWDEIPQPERAAADGEVDPAKWFRLVYPAAAITSGTAATDGSDEVDAEVVGE